MENEIWKDIEGFEGYYQASNSGRIKSIDRIVFHGKIGFKRNLNSITLKPKKDHRGYLFLALSKDGKVIQRRVHTLIARTFLDNPNNLKEVNHKDGDELNNKSSNLEWSTRSLNLKHAYLLGMRKSKKGEEHNKVKLKEFEVYEIRKMLSNGIGNAVIGSKYGVHHSTINAIRTRKSWKHLQP